MPYAELACRPSYSALNQSLRRVLEEDLRRSETDDTVSELRNVGNLVADTTCALDGPDEKEQGMRNDTKRMQQLRKLFVDRCQSYYGVPYKKKYHDDAAACKCGREGCNLVFSPIFLDCCGLVRQVLLDLRKEFGFNIGAWNQAYQFDTLPIRYDSWDQMKPGDLVFAQGTVMMK